MTPSLTPQLTDAPAQSESSQNVNIPGKPGFRERRRRETRSRMVLFYVTITGLSSLALGRIWGLSTDPQTLMPHGTISAPQIEAPVEVIAVHPREGGLPRKIVQTGTIEPIETAHLKPRVSGYIRRIAFGIGEPVEAGEVLVEIDAEELIKDVERQAALVCLAESKVLQAKAHVRAIGADREAARGSLLKAKAEVVRSIAESTLRESELQRIQMLVADKAIEKKLADEKQFELDAARAGTDNARAAEAVARAKMMAIDSLIERAEADIVAAEADVKVAQVDLERAKVTAVYLNVKSPFAGVVTARNFDRGDYVDAASGHEKPLLTVARTDRMRAVLQIPAPDVPYVRPGQPAQVSVSSLGGRTVKGVISRISRYQDLRTRTMRVEVDLPNSEQELAGGMYGSVCIEVPAPTRELTLPKSCLVGGRALNGKARVYELIEGRIVQRSVGVGREYSDRIEILEGIELDDLIVTGETTDFRSLRSGRLVTLADPAEPAEVVVPALERDQTSKETDLAGKIR